MCANVLMVIYPGQSFDYEVRTKRGMSSMSCCDIFGKMIESALHAVRNCPSARLVWQGVVPQSEWDYFFSFLEKTDLCGIWIVGGLMFLVANGAQSLEFFVGLTGRITMRLSS